MNLLARVLELGLDFKASPEVNQKPCPIPTTKTFTSLPSHGITFEELLHRFGEIAEKSTNWASPRFLGFPDAGNALPAIGAAIIVPLLNQNLANQDICSPSATFVEMEVVHWLRQILGYSVAPEYSSVQELGGALTLGGTLSNTVALMAAREKSFPGSRLYGLPVQPQSICVLVPEIIEHYSIRSAMAWLGIGEKQVVRVPVDEHFRIRLDGLARCIDNERTNGRRIIACVAYAGDSRTMCVDNFRSIGACLRDKNVWFHVDACHGFQLAFSHSHRHKLEGIDMADSITIDPHKVLWTPSTCSLVLFKNPEDLTSVSTDSDLILRTQWSLGQITPFVGSKAFDALKLWSTLKYFGSSNIGRLVDLRIEMTQAIQCLIIQAPDLLLLNKTDINSCIFQFIPSQCQTRRISVSDLEKINKVNQCIKSKIIEAGKVYVHGFMLKSCPHPMLPDLQATYVLRTLNGNALTTVSHVQSLLDDIVALGRDSLLDMQYLVFPDRPPITKLPVFHKLRAALEIFFSDVKHVSLIYGSSNCENNSLLSDVDLMCFAEDKFCTEGNISRLKHLFECIMREEGVLLDNEIPFERKILVSFSFATVAANTRCQLQSGRVVTIPRTREFLNSDTMLTRLVFNVLTVPSIPSSGSLQCIEECRHAAEISLIDIANQLAERELASPQEFIKTVHGDGVRSGEDYLGYKYRPNVLAYLRNLWARRATNNPK
ncbi:PLP-dependent transferase [Melanomma pulvis-pyrius CBS 109.77]|uniref:PLP-dependent transferase n=1 Tax=Melanomma pulvis-pyrius CBS 109.77 TaxID=1314802 RepID=A0A6A6WX59_9PLEO|nr:PLP-dependent transferase [Melanomma pulvis-pyrius CBS 109.77]